MPTIYFSTNRNPNRREDPDDFGGEFSSKAIDDLRFGKADLVKDGDAFKVAGIHVASERLKADPAKSKLGSRGLFDDLMGQMQKEVHSLVFIHGYNVTFKEALIAGARIHEKYAQRYAMNVIVFSWPSDGSMMPLLAYKRDRTDAAASAPAFGRALMKLSDFLAEVRRGRECKARIHLMAHSMGNYVLRNGIQEVKRHLGHLPRLFDQIFLMAADEDDDAFELDHKLKPLPNLGAGVNVYFNRGDTALVISDRTKSNPTRLGSQGPREPLNVPGNVSLVDVSEVVSGVLEHSYFWEDPKTVSDVIEVMKGRPADVIEKRRYLASQNRYVLG